MADTGSTPIPALTPAPPSTPSEEVVADEQSRRRANTRASVPSILLFIFLFFVMNNRNTEDVLQRTERVHTLDQMSEQLGNYSHWLHYGNATNNFTLPVRYPAVEPLIGSLLTLNGTLDSTQSSYRTNISGYFDGDVALHNLTAPSPSGPKLSPPPWAPYANDVMAQQNLSRAETLLGTWNWTATNKVTVVAVDRTTPLEAANVTEDVAIVYGRIVLRDSIRHEELSFLFEAVHFINNGSIYGLAEPNRMHPDLRDLPSVVPEPWLNITGQVVEAELTRRMAKATLMIEAGTYGPEESSLDDVPETMCAFTLHAQIEPARGVPVLLMREVEKENQNPSGLSSVLPMPPLAMRGVLLSPECGLLYTITHTTGISRKRWYRKVTNYAGYTSFVYLALVIILSRQVSRSRTPAVISRISRWSFLIQAVVDAVCFAGHVTFSVLAEGKASISLFAPAFLAGLLFAYEVQFALWIFHYQAPESVVVRLTPPAPPAPAPAPAPTPASNTETPEVTQPLLAAEEGEANRDTTTTPTAAPAPPEPARPSFLQLYITYLRTDPHARTYLLMSFMIVISMQLALAPEVGFIVAGSLYACIWIPPIIRAMRRGRSCGLSAEYLIGTTIGRVMFITYLMGCPVNVLSIEPRSWIWLVALFMMAQVGILLMQEAFGPSFFLPSSWTVTAPIYDYHPPLDGPSDAESGSSSSLGDCAICMDAIVQELENEEDSSEIGGFMGRAKKARARKNYALAPCHHLFHTVCLERWLGIKNICPQCRRPLPPL